MYYCITFSNRLVSVSLSGVISVASLNPKPLKQSCGSTECFFFFLRILLFFKPFVLF